MSSDTVRSEGVKGTVRWVLRLEGLAVLFVALAYYARIQPESWTLFFVLFFLPDLALLGYIVGPRFGAIAYNMTHSYIGPLTLCLVLWTTLMPQWLFLVVIWVAHIGFDRALGFGLKYETGFKDTHLGCIGGTKKV